MKKFYKKITNDVKESASLMLDELQLCDKSEKTVAMEQTIKLIFEFNEEGECLGFNQNFVFHHKNLATAKLNFCRQTKN